MMLITNILLLPHSLTPLLQLERSPSKIQNPIPTFKKSQFSDI
ncbi:MAG: hypothetical protein SWX82_32580 [Cyanobacteriota bacterium]|nr:hypothetical protein [Cyanobacteriota bacterium]